MNHACNLKSLNTRLLVICSTLDLDYPYGATPAIWQLLKGLFEAGCDTIVVPYRGRSVRTPWWRCYPNPTGIEGEIYAHTPMNMKHSKGLRKIINDMIVPKLANTVVTIGWRKLFSDILRREKEIDAVMLIGVPLNHFDGLARYIKSEFSCPLVYYDLDVPTSLPKYGGFSFSYYHGVDLTKYDAVIVPSDGVSGELSRLGAKRIFAVHFGVDPDLYLPVRINQDIDVFFFGTSDDDREKAIQMMISEPSRKMKAKFLVSGIKYKVDLGNAQMIRMLPFSLWRNYSARSKINLNIPREKHASIYTTSTSRPFELAAMECCIVSSLCNGLDKWFEVGKEIFVAKDSKEAIELYQWLISDEELRRKVGLKARRRVLREHTFRHRAMDIVELLNKLK